MFKQQFITLLFVASLQLQFAENIDMDSSYCGKELVETEIVITYNGIALSQTLCNMTFKRENDIIDGPLCLFVYHFENVYTMEVYAQFKLGQSKKINEAVPQKDKIAKDRKDPIFEICDDTAIELVLTFKENVQDMNQQDLADKYAKEDVKIYIVYAEIDGRNGGINTQLSRDVKLILVLSALVQYIYT